ncbi:hypothetical protein [Plantactinospora sp. BB1]|uniref:hypothetical protein n=1 Tax=Plantactinospora sp. BB1 TaxID=2071627 RepID=UPI000D172B7A|nr:hypothetical protein [Plantactinospora sp. BB1]AVT39634.1 hypothetical protein C6W10_27920 [Plantactinospora sp. BB1]
MTDGLPSESDLLTSIASEAEVSEDVVRDVLAETDVSLTRPLPAHRRLVAHRLYVSGVKSGTENGTDGPFERDIPLGPGAWAVASRNNSAGKSSLMWALTWALRGDQDELYLRTDTRRWFRYIRVDAEVSGVPVSFRIRQDEHGLCEGVLLTADVIGQLTDLGGESQSGPGVRLVETVESPDAYTAMVGRFMMQRLGLRPLQLFSSDAGAPEEGGERDGTIQVHGWPAYFSVIALASASDSILFGRTAIGQLPTRFIQVFLDVPFTTDWMTADISMKDSRQTTRHVIRRSKADAAVREQRWQPLQEELAKAKTRLEQVRSARPDLPARIAAVEDTSRALLLLKTRLGRAKATAEEARQARIHDDRAMRRASESAAARSLFAALDPHACPRCETSINDERRGWEDNHQRCAVCASPLQVDSVDEDERQAVLGGLRKQLAASQEAERVAKAAVAGIERQLGQAQTAAGSAVAAAEQEQGQAAYLAQLRDAEANVARLTGALEVVSQLGQTPTVDDAAERVLAAAAAILKDLASSTTRDLFTELNQQIVTLARELGVKNLRSVKLDLAGRVNAMKSDNTRPTPFSKLSPGERLRLRIAVIVSLIRVGRQHGIHSHPGLLVIDSPADVEIVEGDMKILLEQLRSLGDNEGLQVVIATMHEAVWDVFPGERLIVGPDQQHLF